MIHDLNLKVHKMFDLAMLLPPMYTMTMLKLSEDYTTIPLGVRKKWKSYGINM